MGGPHAADGTAGVEDDPRRVRLLALLALLAAEGDEAPGARSEPTAVPTRDGGARPDGVGGSRRLQARLGRVCDLSLSELRVSGAGITVMGSVDAGLEGHRDQLWATGPVSRALEDLQLTAGEGPCLDAYAAGAPALAGDLAGDGSRWLGFTPEALAAGVAAVFSLPLQVGAVRLGTLDLHREEAGALTRDQLADALVLAGLATEILLELADDLVEAPDGEPGAPADSIGWLPDVHAEVHQASGMVAARAGIGVGSALMRIRAYAFAHSVPITDVARRIVARELVLIDDPPEP